MASRKRHLKHAPIREAIIDIRVVVPDGITVEKLREHLTPLFKDSYPIVKERRYLTATVGPMDGGEPKLFSENAIDGLFFNSENNTRILQARLDGFSANRLKPYDNFEDFKADARAGWEKFQKFVKPEKIQRLGFRYINDLIISSSTVEASDIFDSLTICPSTDNPTIEGFAALKILSRNAKKDKGHINIEALPQNLLANKIIFDIDVFRQFETSPNEEELWDSLDSLHEWKNDLFFGSLNESHIKQYE